MATDWDAVIKAAARAAAALREDEPAPVYTGDQYHQWRREAAAAWPDSDLNEPASVPEPSEEAPASEPEGKVQPPALNLTRWQELNGMRN